MPIEVNGQSIETDEEGYLVNRTDWNEDVAKLHHDYATARVEFREALKAVATFHAPDATPAAIEETCRGLLELLV